ncbi:MAG: hypothetical protein J7M25_14505 [Deltaproteobacteria bacterium]|nr:hypothetical protein [Deltaproteobacteria bacterium]
MNRVVTMSVLAALGGILLGACQNDLNGVRGVERPGVNPPTDQIFFPTGLAVSPDGKYLFVANSNADIRYNGGTIAVVNLAESNARFRTVPPSCRQAAQDPYVIECDETAGLVIQDATVRVGQFPSQIALLRRPAWSVPEQDGAFGRYRLYVAVRGDPSVTYMDVLFDGDGDDAKVMCLTCGENCAGGSNHIRDCNDAHVVSEPPDDAPFITASLPDEPYALSVDSALRLMYVVHLSSGAVSLFDLSHDDVPILRQVLDDVLDQGLSGKRGGFDVVSLDPGDPDAPIFVSARTAPLIAGVELQAAAVQETQCAFGFCHGRICSHCSSADDCPGTQACKWSSQEGIFACRGGDKDLGTSCSSGECASGFCTGGVCSECAIDDDCAGAATCVLDNGLGYHRCESGALVLGASCQTGAACTSGFCRSGLCSRCSETSDCHGSLECRPRADGGTWYFDCVGGMGVDGARCFEGSRSAADGDTVLSLAHKVYLSVPGGPMENTVTGDIRGLAVSPDSSRLFAVSRVPPALVEMDASIEDGQYHDRVVNALDVCAQPSELALRTFDGWLLAYITCWATGEVFVVDPNAGQLVSVIPVGKGPHGIVFGPDEPWVPPALRYRAYVSDFAENTISVIDLDPSSPTWNRVVGRIGLPEKAVKQ